MSGHSTDGRPGDLAFVMGGGGARAAYQAGVLRYLSRRFPDLQIPIITGVSAGAINAAHLAAHHGTFEQATEELYHLWSNLNVDHVFRTDAGSLGWHLMRWARQLVSGGAGSLPPVRGLLDTDPLRAYLTDTMHAIDGELTGINYNLQHGPAQGCRAQHHQLLHGAVRPLGAGSGCEGVGAPHTPLPPHDADRRACDGIGCAADSSFPRSGSGEHWFGDGGIRLATPLSPALHLGATHILAISTRRSPTARQANRATVTGYPPPAQVAGIMMNSVFLDMLDDDAHRLETINRLLAGLPPEERIGMRPVRLLTVRPSVDLARLANRYEPQLPRAFRFLTRGLGTRQIEAPDFLSMIMFQPDYLAELIRVGEEDAEAREAQLVALLEPDGGAGIPEAPREAAGSIATSGDPIATDGGKAG